MKMEYELQANFEPSSGIIIIDLPMRYHDYYLGNGAGSLIATATEASMVDSSLLSVSMVSGGTTYWPPTTLLEENQTTFTGSSGKDTKITATFGTTAAATIASGSTIEVYITGIKNPASDQTQTNFRLTEKTASGTENASLAVTVGLETCVYESEEGSATAVIGYDRVDTTEAIYRFRFKSKNVYPSLAGLEVTFPSAILHTTMTDYTLTCITGCTAATVTPTLSGTDILRFENVFTAEVAAGTVIDL